MTLLVNIVFCFTLGLTFAWLFYAIWLIQGWRRVQKAATTVGSPVPVTLVIPVRNEIHRLESLIRMLKARLNNTGSFSVIFVDDASTDGSDVHIKHAAEAWEMVTFLPANGTGKKAALDTGIRAATTHWIVTLDADVYLPIGWADRIQHLLRGTMQMWILPIKLRSNGFLGKLFALEFLSLAGTTGAAAAHGEPFLCNGAHLAFRKEAFLEVNGYGNHQNRSSGDDVFLLHALQKRYPGQVGYAFDVALLAESDAPPNLATFFNQRTRWASKASDYRNGLATLTSWLVFLLSLSFLISAVLVPYDPLTGQVLLACFSIKFIVDFLFLFGVARAFHQRNLLIGYLPLSLLYPFYILITVAMVLFSQPEWKGRKIR